MPRRCQTGTAGTVFHVLNRGVRRWRLFDHDGDYLAFLDCLADARRRYPVRLLAYCLMPNHFHLVVWPTADRQLSEFMRILTLTHSKRWHACRGTTGTGHVYQGRYKAFPVQEDNHFLTVCRYVERNPARAGLVDRAERWPWSSLGTRGRKCDLGPLDAWPIPQPPGWTDYVNDVEPGGDVKRLRKSVARNAPFGADEWSRQAADRLALAASLGARGRPAVQTIPGVFLRKP